MMDIKQIAPVLEPIVVVDIGCRWGFAERFLRPENLGKFKIYGFDPDEDECERLQATYAALPESTVVCVPNGLAGKEGRRNLYITKEPACSSLHPPIQFLVDKYPELDCIRLEKVVSIDVTTLQKWARANGVRTIDYIKIDTQGSELEILRGAGDVLDTVRCIDVEVEFNPIYEGQCLFGEVDNYLRSRGFQLWRFSNLVHYSKGSCPEPLGEMNAMSFDTRIRQQTEAFGGQLFWADARYVHSSVLLGDTVMRQRSSRDISLFGALGMKDIVAHIQGH